MCEFHTPTTIHSRTLNALYIRYGGIHRFGKLGESVNPIQSNPTQSNPFSLVWFEFFFSLVRVEPGSYQSNSALIGLVVMDYEFRTCEPNIIT